MDTAIVLDILPSGAPFSLSPDVDSQMRRRGIRPIRGGYLTMPLVFSLAKNKLFLSVAVMSTETPIKVGEEVDLTNKEVVSAWARIDRSSLSSAAKSELEDVIDTLITGEEARFIDFFNRAPPITTRLHSLELIPGIGKKHMWEIIEQRRKPFESLAELKERVPLIPDPKRGLKERILKELQEEEKYYLFVLPPRR